MKIFILSNIDGVLDEGQRNVAVHLCNELSKKHAIYHVNARKNVFSSEFWKILKKIKPDIVHIFLRPYISTLLYGKILKFWCRDVKTIISALQPPSNLYLTKTIMPFLRPDLILVFSLKTREFFNSTGCVTALLGCGVDIEKFVPATQEKKLALRERYGIDKNKFVILHVGPITSGRNLLKLTELQNLNNNQVIIVTTITFKPDPEVYQSLKKSGCIVFREYFEHIEEIYQLADCYIFPTLNASNCIELPLSILEAMACNLPTITTRFGGLSMIFSEGEGLFFIDSIDNKDDILLLLKQIKSKEISIKIRKKVINHTWRRAAEELEGIYKILLVGE